MPQFSQQPILQQTANMATTTYGFSYTTYTNTAPASFVKPTVMPTGMFSFGPVMSCTANSAAPSASARPSGAPLDTVSGSKAGCIISNEMEVNTHAFWDLYDCCKGGNITSVGKPLPCSAQCAVGSGQTWQELGECLSKRVSMVVCKPADNEIGSAAPSPSASGSGAASASPGKASASSVVQSAGASSVDVTHATFSKAGVFVFAMVAVSSAMGMFL